MNVLTSAFSAEYGRTTGGAINLVTKAGTNDVHVDATGLYRPGSLSADQPVTGTSGYDNLWQGSGIVSGPIVADKVYFSVGGEYNAEQPRLDDHLAARSRHLSRRHFEQSLVFARIDADLNDQNHVFGKFTGDRLNDTNPQDVVGGHHPAERRPRVHAQDLVVSARRHRELHARALQQRAPRLSRRRPDHAVRAATIPPRSSCARASRPRASRARPS